MWIYILLLVPLLVVAVNRECGHVVGYGINVIWSDNNAEMIGYKSVAPGEYIVGGNEYIYIHGLFGNGLIYEKESQPNLKYCTLRLTRNKHGHASYECKYNNCKKITDVQRSFISGSCLNGNQLPDFINVHYVNVDNTFASIENAPVLTFKRVFPLYFPLITADVLIWFKAENALYHKYTTSADEKTASCGIIIEHTDTNLMQTNSHKCEIIDNSESLSSFQCVAKTHDELSNQLYDDVHANCWVDPYPEKLSVFDRTELSNYIIRVKLNLEKINLRGDIASDTPHIFFEEEGVYYEIDQSSQSQELACPIILPTDLNLDDDITCQEIDFSYNCFNRCEFGSDSYYSVIAVHWNDQPNANSYKYYKYLESWMNIMDIDSIIKVYSNEATTGAYYILDDNINMGKCKIDFTRPSSTVNTLKCNYDSKICIEMTVDGNTELTNRACLDLAPSIQVSFLKFNLKKGVRYNETISHSYRRVENGYFSTNQGMPFIHIAGDSLNSAALFVKDESIAHKYCYHVYDSRDQHEPETMSASMGCDLGYQNFLRCSVMTDEGCEVTSGNPTCDDAENMPDYDPDDCQNNGISIDDIVYTKIDDFNSNCIKKLCNEHPNVINLKPRKDFQAKRKIDGWYKGKDSPNGLECKFTCSGCSPLSREILYDNTDTLMPSGSCPEYVDAPKCNKENGYKYIRIVTVSIQNDVYCNWNEKPKHLFKLVNDDINEDCLLYKSNNLHVIMLYEGSDKLITFEHTDNEPTDDRICEIKTTLEYTGVSVMCSNEDNENGIRDCKNIHHSLEASLKTLTSSCCS